MTKMKRLRSQLSAAIMFAVLMGITTGCWDMVEPNERSIWVGTGLDSAAGRKIDLSAQIAVPRALGEGGGQQEPYMVKSTVGRNLEDCFQKLQAKLSRRIFLGHRNAVFVGQEMAEKSMKRLMDEFGRNPRSNIRAKLFLVKGATAKSFLAESGGIEYFSTEKAIRQTRFNGINDKMTTMIFFKEVLQRDGMRPLMQVVAAGTEKNPQSEAEESESSHREIALFNNSAAAVGYLQEEEAIAALWAAGYLKDQMVTETVNGQEVTIDFHHMKRTLKSKIAGENVEVKLALRAQGIVDENDTDLNLFSYSDMKQVEQAFNQRIEQQMNIMIKKVQQKYKTDIFGFGEDIHRRYPKQWNQMKGNWDERFPKVKVTVISSITIRHIGERGPK
ncbi:hypothetical protein AWM70_07700 [Paenibacillus yonginensis]|uniref:Uncharacterized protein n=1 Tax=Paenibacillus yonginensis TaxID=1462996 RepID=A0A1B1MZ77_9BACL|nr:Ger(x)C family spore germination protein [Paenibacillus yonginensis]ANS74482.1 hypothetical protein AWM70_07700 [Paenibacillus yonginensis]